MSAVGSAIGFAVLLSCLLGDCQAVDTEVLADARNDEMSPSAIHKSCKDKVRAKIPQLGVCRQRAEGCARDGKVGVIHKKSPSNHGSEHDGPVWKRLVGEMGQNNLGCHATENQGHCQAVQDKVVVLEQVGVW